ncbi:subtilisin inhibitor [Nicotiana tabacum]|uniref:Subtilisin inhibitor n=2 Tax=Nicotiana TaxID=4085 RepID=A0A1S4CUI3_TOBAC|nr:PREDICTED: subtilisin inhibitor-like [Nicotiana sylvestris]XP_016504892.1 PREDICTED: subtilisin inhibitor-like [Nicotiana tabacum]
MAEDSKKLPDLLKESSSSPLPILDWSNPPAGKMSWPELVGMTAEEAEKKIKEEKPELKIHIIPPNSMVTMDYRLERVRIFVDASGKVAQEPQLG